MTDQETQPIHQSQPPSITLESLKPHLGENFSLQLAELLQAILLQMGFADLNSAGVANLQEATALALTASKGYEALSAELNELQQQQDSLKRQAEKLKEQWLQEQGYPELQEAHSRIYWAKHYLEEITKTRKNQEILQDLGLREGMRVYKTKARYTGGWGGKRVTQQIFGYVHVVKQGDYYVLQENRQLPKLNTLIVRLEAAGQPGKRWENFSPEWKAVPVEKA